MGKNIDALSRDSSRFFIRSWLNFWPSVARRVRHPPRSSDIRCYFGSGQHLVVGSFHPTFGSLSISRGMIQGGCLLKTRRFRLLTCRWVLSGFFANYPY